MDQKTVIRMGTTCVGRTMEDLMNVSDTNEFKITMMSHFRFHKKLLIDDINILYKYNYVISLNDKKHYIKTRDKLEEGDQPIELLNIYDEEPLKKIIMVLIEYKNILKCHDIQFNIIHKFPSLIENIYFNKDEIILLILEKKEILDEKKEKVNNNDEKKEETINEMILNEIIKHTRCEKCWNTGIFKNYKCGCKISNLIKKLNEKYKVQLNVKDNGQIIINSENCKS